MRAIKKIWNFYDNSPDKLKEIAMLGDVYVSTTSGEGFGKCLLEAQVLGMPVVATKYSAVPEVVGKAGVLVPSYRGRKGLFRWHDNIRSVDGAVVNEERFAEALYRMYVSKEERDRIGMIGRKHAQTFDYDKYIVPQWNDVLSKINPDIVMAHELLNI